MRLLRNRLKLELGNVLNCNVSNFNFIISTGKCISNC